MDLNEIQCFTRVADAGSFTTAARTHKVPKSTLSRKVSGLERRLGVSLFRRTTRQVKLTEVGLRYYQICKSALTELENADLAAASEAERPHGKLKITAPLDLGIAYLARIGAEFTADHPEVELEFNLDDTLLDLIEHRIDIALRAGHLEDSSLKAQRLGYSEFQLYASPTYLKKNGEPKSPRDLEHHRCILFSNLHPEGIWPLSGDGTRIRVHPNHRIFSDSLNMSKFLAIEGAGIALIPVFLGHEEVQRRQLVRVLKNWGTDREPVYAVYPDQPYVPRKTRLFLDYLKKNFKGTGG
jgi:DNA-binding transcriptional LysR family regulator